MIEKQLKLPTLEDWIDIDGGAYVRLPIAIIKLAQKNAKVRCIAPSPVDKKRRAHVEKSAIGSQPETTQYDDNYMCIIDTGSAQNET